MKWRTGQKKFINYGHVNFLFNNMACSWRWSSPDCIAEFGAADPLAVISGRKEGRLVVVVECKVLNRLFSCMCVCVCVCFFFLPSDGVIV